jgi:hypothetical protein
LDTNPGIISGYCCAAAGHQIELTLQQINKCMAAAAAANCNHSKGLILKQSVVLDSPLASAKEEVLFT